MKEPRGDLVHFLLLSFWASEESMANFVGPDLEAVNLTPEEKSLLIAFESKARNYKVICERKDINSVLQAIPFDGGCHGCGVGVDFQFVVDAVEVGFYCALGDPQMKCDLFESFPACQIEHFAAFLKPETEGDFRVHWGSFWVKK